MYIHYRYKIQQHFLKHLLLARYCTRSGIYWGVKHVIQALKELTGGHHFLVEP